MTEDVQCVNAKLISYEKSYKKIQKQAYSAHCVKEQSNQQNQESVN